MHLTFIILSLTYFISRLINLTVLPIFNDEAIYLHWGWIETHIPNQLFYSLFDAKQPMLIWIFGWAQNIFSDPLWAGRIISVIFGYLTMVGLYLIGKSLFNKRTATMAELLYCFIPLFFLYDRQALMESAIAACGVWSFYWLMALWKTNNTRYAVYLGLVLGCGFFIKSSSTLFFIPAGLLLFKKPKIIISFLIALIVVSPLLAQSQYWQTLSTNSRYSLSLTELFRFPINIWLTNVTGIIEIIFWQLTPFVFVSIFIGLFLSRKKFINGWLLIVLSSVVIFTRNVSARYIVSYLPLFLLYTANSIDRFHQKKILFWTLILLVVTIPVYLTFVQMFNPVRYFSQLNLLTKYSQKYEYVTGWPSGYGVKEAVDYVKNLAANQIAVVGVRPDSGNPEDAVFDYLTKTENIKTVYLNN